MGVAVVGLTGYYVWTLFDSYDTAARTAARRKAK